MSESKISLRLEDEEKALISQYANIYGISMSEFVRQAAIEKLENELDIKAYEAALKEFEADPVVIPFSEIEKKYL